MTRSGGGHDGGRTRRPGYVRRGTVTTQEFEAAGVRRGTDILYFTLSSRTEHRHCHPERRHCHPERNGNPVILNGTKWSEGSVKDSSLTLRMTGRDKTLSFNVLSISGMLLSLPRVSGRVGVRGVGEISLAAGTPFRFRRARASAFRLRSA